ncbi:ESCRT-II subunit protein snf8 [Bulinus truncatus]|nr:ESCRT-II subunit protein snf8 [Bulinus truncatus]
MLGVGDFYYELAIQIVEVCLATSKRNGVLQDHKCKNLEALDDDMVDEIDESAHSSGSQHQKKTCELSMMTRQRLQQADATETINPFLNSALSQYDVGFYVGKRTTDEKKYTLLTNNWCPDKNYIFPVVIQGNHITPGIFVTKPLNKYKDVKMDCTSHVSKKYHQDCVKISEDFLKHYEQRSIGLITIEDLRRKVESSRGRNSQQISIDDLLRSIKKLKILGNGFCVHKVGSSFLVQSIPGELTLDHTVVLQQAQEQGHVTLSSIIKNLAWEEERAKRAMDFLVKEGLSWVDDQSGNERSYWFPSLIPDFSASLT